MAEKDFRPDRYLLSIRYAQQFVQEFFKENPISQLSIIGMRDGLAESISETSGNVAEHTKKLENMRSRDPAGSPSLQNALDMARATLFASPSHGTKEIIIIYGAVVSADPGDIHATINNLVADKIRCFVVGLAAQMAICQELCSKTNGVSKDDRSVYNVAIDKDHFRDLLMAYKTPPIQRTKEDANVPSLLPMGFPSRTFEEQPSLCACHQNETRSGYLCTRCQTKVCTLPAQCPACDLQLIESTHLARSYHHLFPLRNYVEVSWQEAATKESVECFACLMPFPKVPSAADLKVPGQNSNAGKKVQGASESSRYRCTSCNEHFCIDCDVFAHETLHNCAGCLCNPAPRSEDVEMTNGDTNGHVNGA